MLCLLLHLLRALLESLQLGDVAGGVLELELGLIDLLLQEVISLLQVLVHDFEVVPA